MSIIGIIVGALVALLVYAVGTAISTFANEGLIWGIIAILVWALIALRWRGDEFITRR